MRIRSSTRTRRRHRSRPSSNCAAHLPIQMYPAVAHHKILTQIVPQPPHCSGAYPAYPTVALYALLSSASPGHLASWHAACDVKRTSRVADENHLKARSSAHIRRRAVALRRGRRPHWNEICANANEERPRLTVGSVRGLPAVHCCHASCTRTCGNGFGNFTGNFTGVKLTGAGRRPRPTSSSSVSALTLAFLRTARAASVARSVGTRNKRGKRSAKHLSHRFEVDLRIAAYNMLRAPR